MAAKTSSKYNYDVAIDAGHGSSTAGKRTPDGYREHYINVMVSYYEEQYLKARGLRCLRVGWDDTNAKDDPDVSLTTRQKQIKNAKCRVVSSNHANAFDSNWNQAKGVETLVHITASKRGDSVALAKAIQNQLVKGTEQTNRGVKYQSLAMCNCKAMGCEAAALAEIGFMTNKEEAALMKTKAFCKEQGEDIARGVLKYLGVADKVVETSTDKTTTKKRIVDPAQSFNKSYAKTYTVTASELNLRDEASASDKDSIITAIPKGKKVTCYGYYTKNGSTIWLLVQYGNYTGYVSKAYLK